LAAQPISRLLYAGKFSEYMYLVPWVSVAAVFGLPAHAIDMGLRALRSPKSIFTSSCIAACGSIAVTVPLTWLYGMRGAICSIVISNGILLTILIVIFRRKRHPSEPARELAMETLS
jgi:O-antigen/teichoic acid export membrane protein